MLTLFLLLEQIQVKLLPVHCYSYCHRKPQGRIPDTQVDNFLHLCEPSKRILWISTNLYFLLHA